MYCYHKDSRCEVGHLCKLHSVLELVTLAKGYITSNDKGDGIYLNSPKESPLVIIFDMDELVSFVDLLRRDMATSYAREGHTVTPLGCSRSRVTESPPPLRLATYGS